MAAGTPVQEPDFIRRAFRVLNLQAVIGLIVVIVLPYAMSIRIVSDLFADMTAVWVSYSEYVRDEFLRNPGQQAALTLAEQHHVLIGYEDAQGSWYTDGKTVTAIEGDEERPYYQGLARRFNVADGTRLIITFPSEFFAYAVHLRIFLSWAGAPLLFFLLLFFLLRRTLYPLRWMQQGIQELTAGNLAFTAPTTGRDRNNRLAMKFNAMTASIRSLIQSKDQLIMDLSHELRSPITRIKVALALLPPHPNVAAVEKNIQNLEDILTTLLEAQRINLSSLEQKRESCLLAALVREVAELAHDRAPGLSFGEMDETLRVSGDKGLLKLLVHNLLDNALKYSGNDSRPVLISLSHEAGNAVLTLVDDGPGIPEQHLTKVFEPFYKVAPERGFNSGYGLGLSLCKRIVELHGGSITLQNNAGRGLQARVVLAATAG